ncbi:MAG: T9SS type A sorting domain-containing protein [Balneolaceae bacterium]|nr:T9SS type A sorting domain-containing protein [Balneolaceae bacterium]
MQKLFYISLSQTIFFSFFVINIHAQDSLTTPFFPYQQGDILVYSVYDFDGNYLKDTELEITIDSVGPNGIRYLQSFLDGQQYSIDSIGNIYSSYFYGVDDSKVFDHKASVNTPWIQKKTDSEQFELAIKREIKPSTSFEVQDTLALVEYYLAQDSVATSGLQRAALTWSYRFGLIRTFDYEGGNRNVLKGAVLNGEVYGDTTVYTPPPPSEVQKDYFPYRDGDVLIYTVTDSLGNQLSDSKIRLVQDSVDTAGSVWYSVEAEGHTPFITRFKVDTSRNVYGTGWWENNEELWMIYDAYNEQSVPWIALKKEAFFELGMVLGIEIRSVFGRNFGVAHLYNVFTINYYLAEDSTTQGFDTYEGKFRTYAEWDKDFGIFQKYEYDTGLTYDLKGGVISGFVFGDTSVVITSNEPGTYVPSGFKLFQNYPNPFNPATSIQFDLPNSSTVSLIIYDIQGRLVSKLIDEQHFIEGTHTVTLNLSKKINSWASGVYFYELRTAYGVQIKPMTLLK